jgi:hypothetical protein
MHWFWRASLAVLISCVPFLVMKLIDPAGRPFYQLVTRKVGEDAAVFFLLALPCAIVGIFAYAALSYASRSRHDKETHCRKCHYILRGITEPRCPECGERI